MKNGPEANHEERRKFITGKDNSTMKNKESELLSSNTEDDSDLVRNSLKCGFASYRPNWLQRFSNAKSYAFVYSLILTSDSIQSSYFFGTLSSIEKNFEMTATMLGILKSIFELGYLATSLSLAYFIGKGNKIRWISIALLINGIFSLVRIVPHFMDARTSNTSLSTVHDGENGQKDIVNLTVHAFYFFIFAQLITGMGRGILKTSGLTYLDHNTRKNSFPLLLAIVGAIGEFGSSLGYLIAFYVLQVYVFPSESESLNYSNKSYQWIGAWWLGWIPISTLCLVLCVIISYFPYHLPEVESRKEVTHLRKENKEISVSDFCSSCRRILCNKLAVLDMLATIALKVAFSGYELFFPKYLESQYDLSSAFSSFLLAILKFIERPITKVATGFCVTKFKPEPRSLIKYYVITKFFQIGVISSFIFISCSQPTIQGKWMQDNSLNLTTECNINYSCAQNTKHSPVCNAEHNLLFYSPCHAGCSPILNEQEIMVHRNCSCVPNFGPVTEGLCPTNCKSSVIIILSVSVVFNACVLGPVGFGRRILRYRIVDEEDKSLHYGIRKFTLAVFGLLSSIIYGSLIDQSCILFENTSRGKGHCLIYDLSKLRYLMNSFAVGGVFISIILEIFSWYYVKDTKMYDEDFQINNLQNLNKKCETEERFIQK